MARPRATTPAPDHGSGTRPTAWFDARLAEAASRPARTPLDRVATALAAVPASTRESCEDCGAAFERPFGSDVWACATCTGDLAATVKRCDERIEELEAQVCGLRNDQEALEDCERDLEKAKTRAHLLVDALADARTAFVAARDILVAGALREQMDEVIDVIDGLISPLPAGAAR